MARDPNDVFLHKQMPDYFAKKAEEMGAPNVDGLSDAEYHAIANEAFRVNTQKTITDGPLPGWIAKAQRVGLTDDAIAEANAAWDGSTKAEALAKFQREAARFGGFNIPEPDQNKLFDDPCADWGRSKV